MAVDAPGDPLRLRRTPPVGATSRPRPRRSSRRLPVRPRSRAIPVPHDRDLHRERHLVGCFFSETKPFRRIAARYEATARDFPAVIQIGCAMVGLR